MAVCPYQQVPQMAVSLDACLEDATGIVDTARVALKTQQHLLCGGRAVDTVYARRHVRSGIPRWVLALRK